MGERIAREKRKKENDREGKTGRRGKEVYEDVDQRLLWVSNLGPVHCKIEDKPIRGIRSSVGVVSRERWGAR